MLRYPFEHGLAAAPIHENAYVGWKNKGLLDVLPHQVGPFLRSVMSKDMLPFFPPSCIGSRRIGEKAALPFFTVTGRRR